jgi:hypothetical protein
MAQYVPYVAEVFPEPALYKPDFNFFERMLQKKQSLYEQGVSRVRSSYNSVLSAPLSDEANIPLRDQYVKDAREKLKSISSADLSMPQNIASAEGIFAPFWEDKMILQDASLTKWYQGEAQKLSAWKNSTDPKIRSKYNGIAEQYLMDGHEKLRKAGRNEQAYASIEKRQATPFENIQEYLQQQAKDQGMDIKNDDPAGPYLIQTINGERSKKKYATWASAMMGNNFYEQFKVTGIVEKEQRAKAFKKMNPNLSDQDIDKMIGDDAIYELDKGFKKRVEEVDVELAKVNSLLGSLPAQGGEKEAQIYERLIDERTQLLSKKSGINEEYKYFDEPSKTRLKEAIAGNPDAYFAQLAKQRTVDNWATGRASVDSKLVKENSAWTAAEGIQLRRQELAVTKQKAEWDREQNLWERANPTAGKGTKTTTLKNANGDDITPPVEGLDRENSMMYRGLSGIDITKNAGTALDVFNKIQTRDYMESYNLIFDQRGILGLAKKGLGLNESEISYVATALQKENESAGAHKFTKEEREASNKLTKALESNEAVKNSGIKVAGPATLRQAMLVYAKDYFSQRNANSKDGNDIALDKNELDMLLRYTTAVQKLDRYNQNETKREELIKKNILTNKNYAPLVVDRGGKKDLISISDMSKNFKSTKFQTEDGESMDFSSEDIARAYFNGSLSTYMPTGFAALNASAGAQGGNVIAGYTITGADGKKYNAIASTNLFKSALNTQSQGLAELDNGVRELDKRFKSSQDFSKLIRGAQESVVPDLLMYKGQTGKQGTAWTLITKPNKSMADGDTAAAVIDQALNISNGDIYNENGSRVDATTVRDIRALLKSEKNMEDFVSVEYIPQGVNGQRTLRLYFNNAMSNDAKTTIGATNIASLSEQTFDVVIKDGATAPALDNLPNSTGYQVYDMLARGKVFKSDEVINASGFKFSITPNKLTSEGSADEKPEYVTVDLEYNLRVNKKDASGKIVSTVEPKTVSDKFNLSGTGAKSPDEIVGYLYKLYYDNLLQNRSTQEEYESYIKNTPAARVFNRDEFFKRDGVVLSK